MDLASLVDRTRNGKTIHEAVEDMVAEARRDMVVRGYGMKLFQESTGKAWTQCQLWKVMKLLNKVPSSPILDNKYSNILISTFEGDEEALKALVSENILALQSTNIQHPVAVTDPSRFEERTVVAGSPLLGAAMKSLVNDEKFVTMMDNLLLKSDMKKYKQEVDDIEAELVRLQEAKFNGKRQVRDRLYEKLITATNNLQKRQNSK